MNLLLKFLKIFVTTICIAVCIYELILIILKFRRDSFQVVNEIQFNELLAPSITLCPGPAWKSPGPFLSQEHFEKSTYAAEEIYHPDILKMLRNESAFTFKKQYSLYYGLCYTLQKLAPEMVSDYSFQIVVNDSLDYNFYLHEPHENEWLFMNVYPYEVPIKYIHVTTNPELGAADIIFEKEITRKIPGKGGCRDISADDFVHCWEEELADTLVQIDIPCKIPAFEWIHENFSKNKTDLEYCNDKHEALRVEKIVYDTAIENHKKNVCGHICNFVKYPSKLSYLGKNVLSKELEKYGQGYYIIWAFYSSLYVNEKVEQYLFDFDSALVAVGGSLGLFLGWSIKSMVMDLAEFCFKAKWENIFKNQMK